MSFEAELKKFELSSVFTINFSWLKRYVESDNGMYTPMKNISDDEFREIENSLYALQATWKAWREAKAQAVPEGFVLVNKKDLVKVLNCVTDGWLVDTDSFEEFKKIESLVQDEVNAMIVAQEPAND